MNCPNCGSVKDSDHGNRITWACGSIENSADRTHICIWLERTRMKIVPKYQIVEQHDEPAIIGACGGGNSDHIPDATKMVETLRAELAESKAVILRLQADNRRITEWFRRLEDAGDALALFVSHRREDVLDEWKKAKEANP